MSRHGCLRNERGTADSRIGLGERRPASIVAPDSTPEATAKAQVRRLSQAHDQLVHIVAPATPGALMLFENERASGKASALGPVPLVRHMTMVTAALLIVFLATATSPEVNATSGDIFTSSGIKLAVNELFLLSAAGIGAAFAALFKANRYVADGTYDSKYESSYWVRFVLGLLAGILLASLIPIKASGSSGGLSKPFLALLGGFSATVVFRILTQVVGTLESLVTGDRHETDAAKASSAHAQAATQRAQDQMRLGADLVQLRAQVAAGTEHDKLSTTINRMLSDLLPPQHDDDDDASASPTSAGPSPLPPPSAATPSSPLEPAADAEQRPSISA